MNFARLDPKPYLIGELLKGRQYKIPVYQRPYSWEQKQVKALLSDLDDMNQKHLNNEDANDLYVGNFIVSKVEDQTHELIYDIVDGQQRLTTLSLIVASLYCLTQKYHFTECFKGDEDGFASAVSCVKDLKDSLWRKKGEKYQPSERVIELGPIESEVFHAILNFCFDHPSCDLEKADFGKLTDPIKLRLVNNSKFIYQYYESKYKDNIGSMKPLIENVVEHVYCVFYAADVGIEGSTAFEIFESINSKGKPLEAIDLIKTRIFSEIPSSESSDYLKLWGDLIIATSDGLAYYLQTYLRAYINYDRSSISLDSFSKLDKTFLERFSKSKISDAYEALLDDLKEKLPYYEALFDAEKAEKYLSKNRFRFFFEAYQLENEFEYPRPLLLRTFDELDHEAIAKDDAESVAVASIQAMVAFLTIMGKGSRDITSAYQRIMTKIISDGKISKDDVLHSLRTSLESLSINEPLLTSSLSQLDCYDENKRFGYSLLSLVSTSFGENNIRWDGALAMFNECGANYQSDHLMPKTPITTDDRIKYYLVGSKLGLKAGSDFPEDIKEGMPFEDFRSRVLNRPGNLSLKCGTENAEKGNRVLDDKVNNYKSLNERSNIIADFYVKNILAIDRPSDSFVIPKKTSSTMVEDITAFGTGSTPDLKGTKPTQVYAHGSYFPVTSYYAALTTLISYASTVKGEQLTKLAKNKYHANGNPKRALLVSDSEDGLVKAYQVSPGVYIETCRSANAVYEEVQQILIQIGEDLEEYGIFFQHKA